MKLNEYQQQADTTRVYPGQGSDVGLLYAIAGIAAEAGEVAGVLQKAVRQDDDFDPTTKFVIESGDTLWHVAAYYTERGIVLDDIELNVYAAEAIKTTGYGEGLDRVSLALAAAGGLVAGAYLDGEDTEPFVALVLQLIAALAKEVGVTLEELAIANLDKLAQRAEAGTLKGSGDNR